MTIKFIIILHLIFFAKFSFAEDLDKVLNNKDKTLKLFSEIESSSIDILKKCLQGKCQLIGIGEQTSAWIEMINLIAPRTSLIHIPKSAINETTNINQSNDKFIPQIIKHIKPILKKQKDIVLFEYSESTESLKIAAALISKYMSLNGVEVNIKVVPIKWKSLDLYQTINPQTITLPKNVVVEPLHYSNRKYQLLNNLITSKSFLNNQIYKSDYLEKLHQFLLFNSQVTITPKKKHKDYYWHLIERITREINKLCPPDECTPVALGRSPTPVVDLYEKIYKVKIETLPLSNLRKTYTLPENYGELFLNRFREFIPNPKKKIMIIDYIAAGTTLKRFNLYLKPYLDKEGFDVNYFAFFSNFKEYDGSFSFNYAIDKLEKEINNINQFRIDDNHTLSDKFIAMDFDKLGLYPKKSPIEKVVTKKEQRSIFSKIFYMRSLNKYIKLRKKFLNLDCNKLMKLIFKD